MWRQLAYGMATFIPGVGRLRSKGTGGTDSARYCYSIWLRHTVMAARNGLDPHPAVIAELGPGDSLGIGLAGLLSGCDRYVAFDVVRHASAAGNIAVLDELVRLFRDRAAIPGDDEFPHAKPKLSDYGFPSAILPESRLEKSLATERTESIRASISDMDSKSSRLQYRVPWSDGSVVEPGTIDMIYSQAVLEHVNDVAATQAATYSWLRPGGFVSHQVDFRCHGTATEWNGHWRYPDLLWALIKGRRPYLLNRMTHSQHLAAIRNAGFDVVCDDRQVSSSHFGRDELAARFREIPPEDLTTSGAFFQAVKR